jgi:hypothetical protein
MCLLFSMSSSTESLTALSKHNLQVLSFIHFSAQINGFQCIQSPVTIATINFRTFLFPRRKPCTLSGPCHSPPPQSWGQPTCVAFVSGFCHLAWHFTGLSDAAGVAPHSFSFQMILPWVDLPHSICTLRAFESFLLGAVMDNAIVTIPCTHGSRRSAVSGIAGCVINPHLTL